MITEQRKSIGVTGLVLLGLITGGFVMGSTNSKAATTAEPTAAAPTDTVTAIIVFKNESYRENASLAQFNATVVGGTGIEFMPVLFVDLPADRMAAVRAHASVATVTEGDTVAAPRAPNVTTTAAAPTPWGVHRINARSAATDVATAAQAETAVAVIDSGINASHPSVADSAVWGANMTGAPQYGLTTADDTTGHGTAVSSIVAGAADSKVTGVAPETDLYAIKVTRGGVASTTDLIRGIDAGIKGPDRELGTDDDAAVITISLGSTVGGTAFAEAVAYANEHATVVSSAGNGGDGDPTTDTLTYPAKYDDAIAVAATTQADTTPTFSAEGDGVELAAPGVNIETAAHEGGVTLFSGTSAAAPHVAGVAALLAAVAPETDPRPLLRQTATDIEATGVTPTSGYGLVNATAALAAADVPPSLAITAAPTEPVTPGESVTIAPEITNTGPLATGAAVTVEPTGTPTAQPATLGAGGFEVVAHTDAEGTWTSPGWTWARIGPDAHRSPQLTVTPAPTVEPGMYSLAVGVDTPAGASVATTTVVIEVEAASPPVVARPANVTVPPEQTAEVAVTIEAAPERLATVRETLPAAATDAVMIRTATSAAGKATISDGTITVQYPTPVTTDTLTYTLAAAPTAAPTNYTTAGTATFAAGATADTGATTVALTTAPIDAYRSADNSVDIRGLRTAVVDWRDNEIGIRLLRDVIKTWRQGP